MNQPRVRKIDVFYHGWGETWTVGTLARFENETVFEYHAEARARGIELSPVHFPLGPTSFHSFEASSGFIPGFIHDALPDGWGLLLIDRVLRQRGVEHPDAFDRLRYIGDNAMGALRFVPSEETVTAFPDWTLRTLAEESRRVHAESASRVLAELARIGGSAQGARPKALVQFDPSTGETSNDPSGSGEPWLFKFPGSDEHKEVCAIEALYADVARSVGLDMPTSTYIDLGRSLAAFGVRRFDRVDGLRVPVHSLAGLLQVDFRMPGQISYSEWLKATRRITGSDAEVRRAYVWMLFNVVFHNRDDHAKNFSWRLSQSGVWEVSPAYDLTFSRGPGGEHHLDVLGHGADISRADLLEFANRHDIPHQIAADLIDRTTDGFQFLRENLDRYPIRKATQRTLVRTIDTCATLASRHR